MKYRAEIDGLRAVAVIPVIVFHAGLGLFSGGYVGVDVFFVISGFLITRIILDEMADGRFSILRFYERRIRRILPALSVMMLVTIPFAWMWMLPFQFKDYAESLFAVTVFASNFLFWRESGYFAAEAEEKPMLHTWSLAVEEQYYMIVPLLLLVLVPRLGWRSVWWLVFLAMISLGLAEWAVRYAPKMGYYLLPTRAWELLIGSIAAYIAVYRPVGPNQALSAIGLVGIIATVILFDATTPFPSLWATIPVVGTALILLYGQTGTWVARLLSQKAFVWIGLISYSAYLWHQPLFAFARIRSIGEPAGWLMGLLALLTLVLAYLSWRFVETPFRRGMPVGRVLVLTGAMTAVLAGFGLTGRLLDGIPERFDPQVERYMAAMESENKLRRACRIGDVTGNTYPREACWYSDGPARILFWGDSHIDTLPRQVAALLEGEASVYHAAFGACPPVTGLIRVDKYTDCHRFNNRIAEAVAAGDFDLVVLGARWRVYESGKPLDNGEGGHDNFRAVYAPTEATGLSDPDRQAAVLARYRDGIQELAKTQPVTILSPLPEAGRDVPKYLAKRLVFEGQEADFSTSAAFYDRIYGDVITAFEAAANSEAVSLFRTDAALCDSLVPGRCVHALGPRIFYKDPDHLTIEGADLIAPGLADHLRAQLAKG